MKLKCLECGEPIDVKDEPFTNETVECPNCKSCYDIYWDESYDSIIGPMLEPA
jgi:uncharacterized protein with PIN domain